MLVLVPTEGLDPDHVVPAARVACLHAETCSLYPVNPVLHYGPVFQYQDIVSHGFFHRVAWWWERCERIWLSAYDGRSDFDDVALDSTIYTLLMRNENVRVRGTSELLQRHHTDPVRKPVSVLSWGSGDDMTVRPLSRKELSYMLQANVVTGLLKGVI